jgi:hypothetical protein
MKQQQILQSKIANDDAAKTAASHPRKIKEEQLANMDSADNKPIESNAASSQDTKAE